MDEDDELEAPFVRAGMVAGEAPDTESVDVFVAWHDVDRLEAEIRGLLPGVCKQLAPEPRFDGRIRFVVPAEFLDDPDAARRRLATLQAALQAEVDQHLPTAANGRKLRVRVDVGD